MYGTREGSIWKNLALAFGDGLAFGAGVNLSHSAAGRISQQGTSMRSLSERLNEIENRIAQARRTDTLPGAIPRKAVEAMIAVVDARLREQEAQFERRLATARDEMNSLHSQFAVSIARLVEEKIAEGIAQHAAELEKEHAASSAAREEALTQRLEPIRAEIAGLQQRAGQTDRELLDLVVALGRLCLETAERLSAAESPAPAPVQTPTPEPSAAPSKTFLRLPLVSSFFVATGGLLLLHYL